MSCDQDDYLGGIYSKDWRPPYDPRNDPTLVFAGYEDDQPVWVKKNVVAVSDGLLGGNAQGPLKGTQDQLQSDPVTDPVEQAARQTIDNLLHNRIPSRTLGDLDKAVQRSVRDHALAGGMGRRT